MFKYKAINVTYIKRHCEEKWLITEFLINNSQRNVCEAGFEWGERRRIFLFSWRAIIRWSLETHRTSKIASEEDESHSRI